VQEIHEPRVLLGSPFESVAGLRLMQMEVDWVHPSIRRLLVVRKLSLDYVEVPLATENFSVGKQTPSAFDLDARGQGHPSAATHSKTGKRPEDIGEMHCSVMLACPLIVSSYPEASQPESET
jgi:hypothetical protein